MSVVRKLVAGAVAAGAVDQKTAQAFVDACVPDVVFATTAAHQAVINTARSIATIVEEVDAKRLPLPTCIDELDLLNRALTSSLAARKDHVLARVALLRVPALLGVSHGPGCPCAWNFTDNEERAADDQAARIAA